MGVGRAVRVIFVGWHGRSGSVARRFRVGLRFPQWLFHVAVGGFKNLAALKRSRLRRRPSVPSGRPDSRWEILAPGGVAGSLFRHGGDC
jgi:hypothetical protein